MRATWMVGCAALLAMTVLVGCGSSTDSGSTADGTTAPAAASAVDASQRLVGQWHGEVWLDEAEVAESGALTQDQVAALKATTMDVQFDAGGKMLLSGVNGDQPYTTEGQWQVVQQEGPRVVIKSVEAEGAEKEILVRFDSEDQFSMSLPEPVARMGAMQFKRLR